MDDFLILLQAKLDEAKSKGNINSDIEKIQGQIDKLKLQAEIDLKSISNITKQLESVIGEKITIGLSANIDTGAINQIKKMSDSATNTVVQNEKKKQEAYKATSDAVVYHAGVISKLNKAETNGRFYGSNRGTGYFGTGHYFVDSATKHELDNNSSYSKLPYTSVDISKYDNLFKATTDGIASKLHSFLENLTKFTQGSDRFNIDELFSQFKDVFTDTTMDIKDFGGKMEQLKTFMSNSDLSDRRDSVSTQFMKSLGYGGVDTRGTKYADTRYGTVIYDLKEESVLQANITDELQKQGQMLEKINYEKGQVFDSSTDAKIREQIDAQQRAAEVQAEFHKIFDTTELDKTDSELSKVQNRLSEINTIISDCESSIESLEEDKRRFAKEMEDFDLFMSEDEIQEDIKNSRKNYQDRIEELSLERVELEKRIPILEETCDKEYKLANEAYRQAEQIVEQRRLESQQSSSTANEVIQNEEKKQQATQESIKLQSELASFNAKLKETGIATTNEDGVVDMKKSLEEVRSIYSDFGKVTIKNEMSDLVKGTEQFRVSIESSNGELKRTESFLMKLSEDGKSFVFADDMIRSSESTVRHLNEQQEATNKIILKDEKLANAMGDVHEKSDQIRQAEEKRQQLAQNKVINKALEDEYKQRQRLADQVNEIQLSMSGQGKVDYNWQVDEEIKKLRNLGFTEEEVAQKVKVLTNAHTELKQVINSNKFDSIESKNRAIIESDKERTLALNQVKNAYKELKTDASQYYNLNKQTRLSTNIQNWLSKNSRASKEAKDSLTAYYRELSNGRVSVDRLNYIEQELNYIDATQRSLGKLGKNLKDQFSQAAQSFSSWLSVTSGIMLLVNQLRKMPQEVIAVNSAMVELNKVSDASASDIKKYYAEAAKSAKDLGASINDLITATADWSRLGYNLPDSKKLAEIATLYKNVGDGIDINTATESLVSTLQGFKLEANDAMHIIDAFNEVGNNFAIGSDGIGEALRRSASSMYAAGNTLEETIGLVTAANTVVQDPDSIGTAYKTLSMRIRGAKTEMEELGLETDGMVESTATLREEIMALSGVDIMKDKDTFKSTYQILDELALKWQDLTDIQRASITELIAGKRQGNIISALMSNFDIARQATETAINSTGSALKEQEKYEQGIQYSLDRLEASFQSLSNTVLDSDLLKGIVDLGTKGVSSLEGIAKVLEYINSLFRLTDSSVGGTLGAASGLLMNKFGIGERTMFQW